MRNKIYSLVLFLVVSISFAQAKYEWAEPFPFDSKNEQDPNFVLTDNYNHYILTVVIIDGMVARRQMILRKFDQKNVLVETFTYDFPKFDIGTLYNYLGFAEDGNGKVAVFTQTYSGKAKKSVIFKHEFDKNGSKFTSSEISSTPILSAMKSGTVTFSKSGNDKFVAINYTMYKAKEEAEKNAVLVIDTKTLNVSWQKEFSFTDDHVTSSCTVTNLGKVVFLRNSKSYKKHNYFVLGSVNSQDEKTIDAEIAVHQPYALSIGAQEYVLAFNYPAKGLRRGDFGNLMLYDLQNGAMIQNVKLEGFTSVKDVESIDMRSIIVENNEIQILTETKTEVEMAKTMTTGNFNTDFTGKTYKFGPANLITLNTDGTLKGIKTFPVDLNSPAPLYHSFGWMFIKGNYYINTGRHAGYFPLMGGNYNKDVATTLLYSPSSRNSDSNVRYVNQLFKYFPDAKQMLFARVIDGDKMALVRVTEN